ncbi:hypothetical protein HDF16_006239 [Granulicella aggregans]|uniref:Uncharacterized protein n=1 Tax=Granulicella aggregans TaxID=474949 RepID=A0A7W8E6S4_9BACT|nr:hypothetical protein [Granulicella aggregans]
MLTLFGFYHLVPRSLQPIVRVLALLVVLAIVIFSLIAFSHILQTLPKHGHQYDSVKSHRVKETQ